MNNYLVFYYIIIRRDFLDKFIMSKICNFISLRRIRLLYKNKFSKIDNFLIVMLIFELFSLQYNKIVLLKKKKFLLINKIYVDLCKLSMYFFMFNLFFFFLNGCRFFKIFPDLEFFEGVDDNKFLQYYNKLGYFEYNYIQNKSHRSSVLLSCCIYFFKNFFDLEFTNYIDKFFLNFFFVSKNLKYYKYLYCERNLLFIGSLRICGIIVRKRKKKNKRFFK